MFLIQSYIFLIIFGDGSFKFIFIISDHAFRFFYSDIGYLYLFITGCTFLMCAHINIAFMNYLKPYCFIAIYIC